MKGCFLGSEHWGKGRRLPCGLSLHRSALPEQGPSWMRVHACGCEWIRVDARGCTWMRVDVSECAWIRVDASGYG